MTNKNNDKADLRAVIYCRVSSTRQKTEGGGLDSQEHRCRQYAAAQGYDVEAVFPDDASGGGDFIKRPGMGRCCTSLTMEDSHRESMPLDVLHEQAVPRPLSHDELVQLQRVAQEAGFSADLGRQGHDLARAA